MKGFLVVVYLISCIVIISAAPRGGNSIPSDLKVNSVDKPVSAHLDRVKGIPGQEDGAVNKEKDHLSDTKFMLPPFLQAPLPHASVFGSAQNQGEVGGLFAYNNNTLMAASPADSSTPAVVSLSSQSSYFAIPINETTSDTMTPGESLGTSLAGFTVTAQEDVQAYAEGEWIQFINHGATYANGLGESTANGTTLNPGNETNSNHPSGGPGWGSSGGPGWGSNSQHGWGSSNPNSGSGTNSAPSSQYYQPQNARPAQGPTNSKPKPGNGSSYSNNKPKPGSGSKWRDQPKEGESNTKTDPSASEKKV